MTGCTNKNPSSSGDNNNNHNQSVEDGKKVVLDIYFTRDNNGQFEPVRVTREINVENDNPAYRAQKALEYLGKGPTAAEKEQGLHNSIPDAQLLNINVQRPHVTLNYSREFEQIGGTARVENILKQLTMTMSSIPGIKSVILQVEGERIGTQEHPYTGEGSLFGNLTPPVDGELAASLGPADTLDLFVAVIPDTEKMWHLMGPKARNAYNTPANIEFSAFAEGLGSWKGYEVTEEIIEEDNTAIVTIKGTQVLEGMEQPEATYTAYLIKEDGQWKWDFPPQN